MQTDLFVTRDGSHSLYTPDFNQTYHSRHGAVLESQHVYIDAGLLPAIDLFPSPIRIFEMGFGTGLNAFLTLLKTQDAGPEIYYSTLEAYPLPASLTKTFNYCQQVERPDLQSTFDLLHATPWEGESSITPHFHLLKSASRLEDFVSSAPTHLLYYDAFAPSAQPELWTTGIFEKLYSMLAPNGMLVTYCSKSEVRRAMMAAGFTVKKIPGPHGKREMVRAVRC